jgi:hypothetical protein
MESNFQIKDTLLNKDKIIKNISEKFHPKDISKKINLLSLSNTKLTYSFEKNYNGFNIEYDVIFYYINYINYFLVFIIIKIFFINI